MRNSKTYNFGKSNLTLKFGDISTSTAEVVVSSDDYMLTMGGGVSAAIRRASGEAVITDIAKNIPAQLGDVIVTTAGALPAKYIFHGITIGAINEDSTKNKQQDTTNAILRKSLSILKILNLHTIAFPALGTGAAHYNLEEIALQISESIYDFFSKNTSYSIDAEIYLFDRFNKKNIIDYVKFFEEFNTKMYLFSKEIKIEKTTNNIPENKPPKKIYDNKYLKKKNLLHISIKLTQERELIERRLAELHGGLSKNEESKLISRLEEIQKQKIKSIRDLKKKKNNKNLSIFISYAHEDEIIKTQLEKHLIALEYQGLVSTWNDRRILPGSEWKSEVDSNLKKADIILMLISSDFIHSKYCYDIEMQEALKKHENNEAVVIPIIIRSVHWHNTPFAKLQVLPVDGKAINEWENKDRVYMEITESISIIATDMLKTKT